MLWTQQGQSLLAMKTIHRQIGDASEWFECVIITIEYSLDLRTPHFLVVFINLHYNNYKEIILSYLHTRNNDTPENR